MMVGLPSAMVETVVRAIKNSCKGRIEFVNTLLPAANIPLPKPIEVKVGGATVFVFEIEEYAEF